MPDMKAAVIYEPGGPEVLKIERRPIPIPTSGQVLIRAMAFGLNRSELFTRQGHSPSVRFPRILGIEAVGTVEDAPGTNFANGDLVATVMGGMGRTFDGSYAEYTCVPAAQVRTVKTRLPWDTLGAIPEMLQDCVGVAVQVAPPRERRAPVDSRQHDFGRPGSGGDREGQRS
jgi:NADPH:quinone reductase-like Zn-dependent oxidoreductase